ncbi:MAG: hypothetical protein KatS3mg102_0263 [Planctomycetota bacterium]|nr:MAG: hypothetical protein KatS3mg102_0263 [Planctomycetota bacterium]
MAMQVFCPRCERSYHPRRAAGRRTDPVQLRCAILPASPPGGGDAAPAAARAPEPVLRAPQRASSAPIRSKRPRCALARGRTCSGRRADELCRMILNPHASEVDIAMERHRLRALAERLFPDQMELYEMIFESRFERLTQQFRSPERRAG